MKVREALQHAATRCNALQQTTATHTHLSGCEPRAQWRYGERQIESDVFGWWSFHERTAPTLMTSPSQEHPATEHEARHCNTLQHAATRCNILQHTAAHCSTLQLNAMQHTAVHCSTLQHAAAYCSIQQHTAAHCSTLQHTATHTHLQKNNRRVCLLFHTTHESVCVIEFVRHCNTLYNCHTLRQR